MRKLCQTLGFGVTLLEHAAVGLVYLTIWWFFGFVPMVLSMALVWGINTVLKESKL